MQISEFKFYKREESDIESWIVQGIVGLDRVPLDSHFFRAI